MKKQGNRQRNPFFLPFSATKIYNISMIQNREPLHHRLQTARRIKHLVEMYYLDLQKISVKTKDGEKKLSDFSLQEFFDFIKNIPYRRDPEGVEVVTRPYYALKYAHLGIDCKKKGTAIAAYLRLKNYKYRAIGMSQRPDRKIHHIFFQYWHPTAHEWRNADATYKKYFLDEQKTASKWEVLK